jgi:glycosyltransferase involved in cell wall biosynthesis
MTSPQRVLHVIDSLDLGGAQTLLLEICRNADRERFEVEVACMHGLGVFATEFEKAGIKVHSLSPAKWPPLYIPNFPRLLRRLDPDVLHFHLFGSNLIAKPLAALAGKRTLIVHDHCNDAGRGNPVMLFADALTNRLASKVIAVSRSIRDFLILHEGMNPDRVVTLSNGIDSQSFLPAKEGQRALAKSALGLSSDAFVIGGMGRLVPQKNFSLFLDVAARVLAKNPSAVFVVAGTGSQEDELKAKAALLGINERVLFLGHVSDRLALYHAFDALLMTSDFEGTPMVLLEAMSCGLPVVASAVDGIAEVCSNGKDAILVAAGDEPRFASSVEYILRNPQIGRDLGKEARNAILERYEIRGLVTGIERVYDEAFPLHPHENESSS